MPDADLMKAIARRAIEEASTGLRALSLDIHAHPELDYQEVHAHAALTAFLEERGFSVTRSAYEIPTAFEATAGSGSPVLAVMCEYDALPGIGHACGHNLIAISGVAVGLALKAALGPGEGTVVVLGSPAEEGGGGKIDLIERGAFEQADAAMMLHPTPGDSAWPSVIAVQQLEATFHGRNAHASAFPWDGVNALDAMVLAYNAISAMRQQLRPEARVHGVITGGGDKPNIIPDRTSALFYLRAPRAADLEVVKAKIAPCFEGAAVATGCRLELRWVGKPYTDLVTNEAMTGAYVENMATLGVHLPPRGSGGIAASTDMGNVSYALPSIHPMFGIPSAHGNHTPGFTAAAATPEAHEATLRAAAGLAMTAIDLYTRPDLLAAAKKEFARLRA